MNNWKNLLGIFVLFRLSNIVFNQTWFVPDEHWQSQEVAHRLAFNYGYLTWEWRVGIRSYAYPLFLSIFYKALEIIGLDRTFLFILISPVIHTLLTAIGDFLFYNHVARTHGKRLALTASLLRCISWYSVYTSSRSLTNSLEELFTIIVLFCWSSNRNFLFHVSAFLAFVIRSTAAINLIPIYFFAFFSTRSKTRFVIEFLLAGILIVSISTLIDSYFHGSFLLTPWNFLLHNVLYNVAIHYGTHPWHWYLTQGFPTLMFAHLLPFLLGLRFAKHLRIEITAVVFNILAYSLLGHKEFRFLSQIMPFAIIVCSYGIENSKISKRKVISMLAVANLVLVTFVGVIHQRGVISVMRHLRTLDLNESDEVILFLAPCHSTPYYSSLHRNVTMRFLTCEPNLTSRTLRQSETKYLDEADQFYEDHASWFQNNHEFVVRTTRLVVFESLYRQLSVSQAHFISKFSLCEKFYHSPVKISSRIDNYIYLCTRKNDVVSKEIPRTEL